MPRREYTIIYNQNKLLRTKAQTWALSHTCPHSGFGGGTHSHRRSHILYINIYFVLEGNTQKQHTNIGIDGDHQYHSSRKKYAHYIFLYRIYISVYLFPFCLLLFSVDYLINFLSINIHINLYYAFMQCFFQPRMAIQKHQFPNSDIHIQKMTICS